MFDVLERVQPELFGVLCKPLGECGPGDLVDRIAATERLVAAAQAEQLRSVHALNVARTAADAAAGVGPRLAGRTVPAEVACARGVATSTARHQVALAGDAVVDHRQLFRLLQLGRISLSGLRKVVEQTAVLEPRLRAEVDANLAAELADRPLTPAQLADAAARQVIGMDPEAALRRCQVERADRRISLLDKHDGTAAVWAKLRAEEAVAVIDTVEAEAGAMRHAGDTRALGELVCDIVVHRLTSPHAPGLPLRLDPDPGDLASPRSRASRRRRRGRSWCTRRVELQVVVSAATFLGGDDAPATLRGYGAIPAELARRIVEDPCVDQVLRRLLCDPLDGRLLGMDALTRCFQGDLRRFLIWRDQTSRFPGSVTAIRDLDHLREHHRGGPTTAGNGQGLDKGTHIIRDHPGVAVRALPVLTAAQLHQLRTNAPTIRWRMPTGHCYDSHPPPALGHGSGFTAPPQQDTVRAKLRDLQAQLRLNRLRRLNDKRRRT